MKVNIQATHDAKVEIDIDQSASIFELKQKISTKELEAKAQELSVTSIRLIFAGKILKDEEKVGESGIKEGNTIHMVKSQKKAEVPKPAAAPAAQPAPPSVPAMPSMPMSQFDPAMMAQFGGADMMNDPFNNPAIAGQADEMMQNPELRRQVIDMVSANPELMRAAMQMNPMFNQMPPEMQQMMMNPDMLRLMVEASASMRGGIPQTQPPAGQPTGLPAGMQNLVQALQSGGLGAMPPAAPVSSEPPEVRFAEQIQQLNDMGFYDRDENIRVLLMTNGNVNAAVERLLSGNQ